jgi:hypothetical protein
MNVNNQHSLHPSSDTEAVPSNPSPVYSHAKQVRRNWSNVVQKHRMFKNSLNRFLSICTSMAYALYSNVHRDAFKIEVDGKLPW